MAGVLSFGQVSSAMAQSIPDAVEVHCAAEVTPLDEPTLLTHPVCFGTEVEVEAYIESSLPQVLAARGATASTIVGTLSPEFSGVLRPSIDSTDTTVAFYEFPRLATSLPRMFPQLPRNRPH